MTDEDPLAAALLPGEPDLDSIEDPAAAAAAEAEWREQYIAERLEDADKIARRRRAVLRRRAQLKATYDSECAQMREWLEGELAPLEHDLLWFDERLEAFHRSQIAINEKRNKTIDLPCGVQLTSTAGRISVAVDDPDALVAWLEEHEHGECITYKDPEPKKREIGALFGGKAPTEPGDAPLVDLEAGEVIPGGRIVRGDRTYDVKP